MEPHAKALERDRVSRGWRGACGLRLPEQQDRCLLAWVQKKLWLLVQTENSDKCRHKVGPHRAEQEAFNPRATISTIVSMVGVPA